MVREARLVAWRPVATIEARQAVSEYFVIEGGRPLSGSIAPEGNKNAALPIIAAALLTDRTVRLSNVPRIRDVEVMCELVADLGASVEWTAQNDLEIRAEFISKTKLDRTLVSRIRASILLAGPLLAASTRTSWRSRRSAPRCTSTGRSRSPPHRGCTAPRCSSTSRA
jgi:UDP-N-acetylglucosamine 1-carboxyvinyltransferase